jgi:tetratricopeptide (TPR) repeat protein
MVVAISITAHAQTTLQDGIKMFLYKKYLTAERILTPLAADPQANYYLGLSYIEQGKLDQANNAFMKFPEDPANISGTARVAFKQNNAAKGMQIAKDLAAKSKKKEWIQEKFAADAVTYTGNDYQQAVAWYKDVLTKTDNPEIRISLGDAYKRVPGGGGEAMNSYESVTDKDNKNSLAYTRIGDLWYEAHNYQSALDNYDKAKNADPANPLPYKALARAYSFSGKYKLALENWRKYYELSDKTFEDKDDFLEGMYLAKDYCDAAKFAEEMMSDPQLSGENKIKVTGVLGFSLAECGDSVKALQYLREYFRIVNPSKIKPGAYIEYGKLFLKLGMYDSAGHYYTKGIEGDTSRNRTDIYRTIAEALKSKKEYCKSAEWYDNLIKANPETQPLDYFWRGYMYYYCHELGKSLKAFEEFEAKYPDQPSAMYWHGRAAAAIDSEATTGAAVPFFTKWLDKVGPNYDKKNDMKIAYEYIVLYYYNAGDKENMKLYMDKLRTVAPDDPMLKQIEEAEKAPAPKKPANKPK